MRMTKRNAKVLGLALGGIICLMGITTVFAAGEIATAVFKDYKIYLNNKSIPLSNPLMSVVTEGQEAAVTYAPARELLEELGYDVKWSGEDNSIYLSPRVVSGFDEFYKQPFPLISADYDEDAYLYAVGFNQAVLKYEGISKAFDWVCTTPRFVLPRMKNFDFDNDGEKELVVSLYVGSGTGVSIDELHIVEKKKDADDFIDNKFMPEDYKNQISGVMSYKIVRDKDKTLINISTEKNSVDIDITDYAKTNHGGGTDIRLAYGSIIEFNPDENGKIELTAGLGVCTETSLDPMYIAQLKAEVTYSGDKFSVSDARVAVW